MSTQFREKQTEAGAVDRLALYTTQAIGSISDDIVSRAEVFASRFKQAFESDAEKSPLRNVLAVATSPDSGIKALHNFILYQGGRGGSGSRFWTHKDNNDTQLAAALVKELNALDEIHQKACALIAERSGEKMTEAEKTSLRLRIMQLFIGYLARTQVAFSGMKKSK